MIPCSLAAPLLEPRRAAAMLRLRAGDKSTMRTCAQLATPRRCLYAKAPMEVVAAVATREQRRSLQGICRETQGKGIGRIPEYLRVSA